MNLDRALLLGAVGLLLVLSVLLVLPYLQFLLAAVVLAFVLEPLQDRLAARIGETASATVLVAASVLAFVLPFLALVAFLASDLMRLADELDRGDVSFATVEEPIREYTGREVDVAGLLRSSLQEVGSFDGVVSAFGTFTHLVIGLGLLVFLLFFFVRDGPRFVEWLHEVSPLPADVLEDLTERLNAITKAVLVGHVLVAVVQGVLAGIGLLVTGVPNAFFWTFVMIVLSLIPVIGSFVVWAPASLYLFATGEVVAAVGLFVYGNVVVGLSDEYLRPVLVDRYASLNPSVILLGVVGGISVFGFMGLFVGPIVVGALKETIEVYDDHYGERREATSR